MGDVKKCMGARLKEGVSPGNLRTYYIITFVIMACAVSTNVMQPYLLSNFLKIPLLEHGRASGLIALVNEFVILIAFGVWGILSDKTGRRKVWAIGCVIVGLGYLAMPNAKVLGALVGFRVIYTIGMAAATGMMATIIADYVENDDRGKANAMMGVMNGLGAATGAMFLGKLPQMFAKRGYDGITSGWNSYYTVFGIAILCAVIAWFGLKKGVVKSEDEKPPMLQAAKEGLLAAKEDAGTALSYLAAFVSRSTLVLPGLYLPLWLSKHFQDLELAKQGLATTADLVTKLGQGPATELLTKVCATGIAKGGMIIGISGMAGLLFAPVIGILCDKINRVTALAIGFIMNVIGFCMVFFVVDPTGAILKVAAIFIGFGQVGATIASSVLIQQQARAKIRGSVIGMFGVLGGLGIMVTTFVGGRVFDGINPQSTFWMLGLLNIVVVITCFVLKPRVKAPENE